jgi:putative transposase
MATNQLWVADITYVRLGEAFVYLAVILDAFSRKVVGWAMEDHLRASLALEALEMALADREIIPGGLVHHTDRGVQYACGDYIARLEAAAILPSMSRAGCPYDNAMAESFMKTLKHEEVDASAYRDLAHARAAIGQFIEEVYNRQRLHSALDYLSPVEFEFNQPWAAAQQPKALTQPSCP